MPPTFAHVHIGAVNGSAPCTTFTNTNLVNAHLSDLTADMAGCATIPLLPGSTAPLELIHELTVADGATVDYSGANFLVTGADYAALAGADLNGINLGGTQALPGASFLGFPADFEGTTFNGASLTGTSFQLADLANAQFESAVAPGANFDDANLNGATFAQGQAPNASGHEPRERHFQRGRCQRSKLPERRPHERAVQQRTGGRYRLQLGGGAPTSGSTAPTSTTALRSTALAT